MMIMANPGTNIEHEMLVLKIFIFSINVLSCTMKYIMVEEGKRIF